MRTSVPAVLTAIATLFPIAASAQQTPAVAPPATVAAVLDRFIAATGGAEAYKKVQNRISEGTFEVPAMGVKGKMKIVQARPNLALTEADLGAMGKTRQGLNGKIAWEIGPQGPRVMTDEETRTLLRSNQLDLMLEFLKLYKKTELVGPAQFGGKACQKVVATPEKGSPENYFFNVETGLLDGISTKLKTPMGEMEVEQQLDDYRKVDDLLLAHTTRQRVVAAGMEFKITFTSVKHNTKLTPETFALPPEIQKIVDRQKPPAGAGATSKPKGPPPAPSTEAGGGGR